MIPFEIDSFLIVDSETLEKQMDLFIDSGFLESRFTYSLYEMLYIRSGKLDENYTKLEFYTVRFLEQAQETIEALERVTDSRLKPMCQRLATAMASRVRAKQVVINFTTVGIELK